jgi:phosphatidylglycerol:prolipoprotein diacylglycerol transferase
MYMPTRTLFRIYKDICIYSFGTMIALGCFVLYLLTSRDPRRAKIASQDQLLGILTVSIFVAVIGGRILHLIGNYTTITHWTDLFALQEGGFSVLGAILALLIVMPSYLKKQNIPVLPFMDLAALYVPILQAVSRFGCFFAGCCYGKPTTAPWGIMYTDSDTLAPLLRTLHPTQLYAAAGDLLTFGILYFTSRKTLAPGQLLCTYLFLSSLNRFIIDFWRDDQEFLPFVSLRILSLHQWIALGIMLGAALYFFAITCIRKERTI